MRQSPVNLVGQDSTQSVYSTVQFQVYFRIRVDENIIIIGDPSETDMPDRRPIGDQHV